MIVLDLRSDQAAAIRYVLRLSLSIAGFEEGSDGIWSDPEPEASPQPRVICDHPGLPRVGLPQSVVRLDSDPGLENLKALFERISMVSESKANAYDPHGRLLGARLEPRLREPVIHDFALALRDRIRALGAHPSTEPNSVIRASAFLSHDVDRVSNRELYAFCGKPWGAARSLLRGDAKRARAYWESWSCALRSVETYMNFDEICEQEDQHGFRSTFFFMVGKRGIKGNRYSLNRVAPTIQRLVRGGWEVGLHINYYGAHDLEEIKNQKSELESVVGAPVEGARFHWLRFDPRRSFHLLEEAGFLYDSTLGFPDVVGSRMGLSAPFRPVRDPMRSPDPGEAELGVHDLLEIPLALMDLTLFDYLKLDPSEAWSRTRQVLESLLDTRSVMSILWHSNVFKDPLFPGWSDVYAKVLAFLAEKKIPTLTGRQIRQSWRI